MPIPKQCEKCGKTYFIPPRREKLSRFCSQECRDASNVGRPQFRPLTVICGYCKKSFQTIACREKNTRFCNIECYKAYRENMKEENKTKPKKCPDCLTVKPLGEFYAVNSSKGLAFKPRCKECERVFRRKYYSRKTNEYYRRVAKEIRIEVIAAYGGKCACCGESTYEFLGIDHIHGGGVKERKETKRRGKQFYAWLKRQGFPKDKYQLLCHNCNLAKGFYGECPHQRGERIRAA